MSNTEVMADPELHRLVLKHKRQLSPSLLRLTFTGDSLRDFPIRAKGSFLRWLLPKKPGVDVGSVELASLELRDFAKRSYTVRDVSASEGWLVMDFVVHDHAGPHLPPSGFNRPGRAPPFW